ncbi:MAG: hypothetical protein ACLFWL_02830 [Candidatus Brocadiia bacterium]
MKVFFGNDLEYMVRELRGKAINNVRLQVLYEIGEGDVEFKAHVTTLCSGQIFETVISRNEILEGATAEEQDDFVTEVAEELRDDVAERLEGFEIRPGVLQE